MERRYVGKSIGGITMKSSKVVQVNKQGNKQVNKQVMKVNIVAASKCIRHPNRRRIPNVRRICGRIFQLCNDEAQEYFASVRLRPRAMIQIENKSSCTMHAFVNLGRGRIVQKTIAREQQISIYVPSIKNLSIQCSGEDDTFCRGYYSIFLS